MMCDGTTMPDRSRRGVLAFVADAFLPTAISAQGPALRPPTQLGCKAGTLGLPNRQTPELVSHRTRRKQKPEHISNRQRMRSFIFDAAPACIFPASLLLRLP